MSPTSLLRAMCVLASLFVLACETEQPHTFDAAIDTPDATNDGAVQDTPAVIDCTDGGTVCSGACVDTQQDNANCGACLNACPAGIGCVAGACTCDMGRSVCSNACVDTQSDLSNCGTCGHACAAGEMCTIGTCSTTCSAPRTICTTGGVVTCVNITSDRDNCTGCGLHCGTGFECVASHCLCPNDRTICDRSCTNLQTDATNCGQCGRACGSGGLCMAGNCLCATGFADCGGVCVDTQTSPLNCGTCGHGCGPGRTCVAGACACTAPRVACGAGMMCTDVTTDAMNCGRCNNPCGTGGACAAGACTCGTGFMMCGGSCVDVQVDGANCGACGTACAVGQACVAGSCVGVPRNCAQIHASRPTAPSGAYSIDPDGVSTTAPISVYCDMVTDGGGWTLGFLKNSMHSGNYPTVGLGFVATADLAEDPAVSSMSGASVRPIASWLDLNLAMYTTLRIADYHNGTRSYMSNDIRRADLRIEFGQSGYLLYNDTNGYYWCQGPSTYTDGGVGQVNRPSGAPAGCKGHGGLGSGWDFGTATANSGLTLCGIDHGSTWMFAEFGSTMVNYSSPGAAYAIWFR